MARISVATTPLIREAVPADLPVVRAIYNQGIEDKIATLDEEPKDEREIVEWFDAHAGRYGVAVAERDARIVGWASLNPYSHRCAYQGVADLSVYVERASRGSGVGTALLAAIERLAERNAFHKIVLFALAHNAAGLRLYRKAGYREVGFFREQGRLDGRFVDVVAMEKIVKPLVLFVCKHNTGRSQMAEAYLRSFASELVEVASAGTIAAAEADPGVVAAMAEDGIDISSARPKLLDPALAARATHTITMGCDVESVTKADDDWGLPDPKGQAPERVREIRDLIKAKAAQLAADFGAATMDAPTTPRE
jgi:L-amino acid N-acyltransferase YncA/protein-tyrosine-phosphatase